MTDGLKKAGNGSSQLHMMTLKDKAAEDYMIKEKSGMQFSHNMTEQIGGQLKAGFTLLDIYEDTNGFGRLHELNIKTYIATKSVKLYE